MAGTPPPSLTASVAAAAEKQCLAAAEDERVKRQEARDAALTEATEAEHDAADAAKELHAIAARQRGLETCCGGTQDRRRTRG